MGGARSPRAGSNGPNVRGAGDREGEGLGQQVWAALGCPGRRGREGPSFSPAVVQRSVPGLPCTGSFERVGAADGWGLDFVRAWDGAGGGAFGAGA